MPLPTEKTDTQGRQQERRLVIVSNRLPFTLSISDGVVQFQASAGGLVTGLASFQESGEHASALPFEHLWVGWPGTSVEGPLKEQVVQESFSRCRAYPIFLSAEQMDQFYLGFCNATIWPLFHYFTSYTVYHSKFWEQYKQINDLFADALKAVLRPDDIVWVHDYHLMLLPRLLKARHSQLSVGFFLHIPFPSFEVFRLLPAEWRRGILEGILGADLIGFHTYEYTHHFLQSTLRILGYEHHMGQIETADHVARVDTFPMGIDVQKFAAASLNEDIARETRELKELSLIHI